jgi:hypothetical protein
MWYRFAQENLEIHPKEQQAREYYKTTKNPYKAGYILRDGTFLDFSEGQPKRTLDHRDIENIMDEPEESKGNRYDDYVYPFMNLTGAIRSSNYNEWDVDIQTPPTNDQITEIARNHVDGRDFHYEVDLLGIKDTLPNAIQEAVANKLREIRSEMNNVVQTRSK